MAVVFDTQDFDYVIVGAGSAGSVLAERLSADGRFTVIVLEAGPSDRRFWVQVPLGYGKTFYDRSINWMYDSEPDEGLGGRPDYWPRGKLLGGSSSINAMVYIRGDARDYDDWAALGATGWSWADVLPVFKSLEDNAAGADAYRATGGRLHVEDVSRRMHPLAETYLTACRQAGFPANADFNGRSQEGVGIYQITTRGGWRLSAARAFLRPAMARPNVTVETGIQVTRVLFEGRRAIGVVGTRDGRIQHYRARREVILAGGAVNSPQLLQLSGIGPAALLRRHGVTVLADHPAVGAHLQDHLGINYTYRSKQATLNSRLRPWWGKLAAGLQFMLAGRGPLSLSLNQGGGFVRTRPEVDRPNIQLYFQAISTVTAKKATRPLLTPDPFPGFSLGLSTTRPTSRGAIEIRSADPFAPPKIMPNAYGTAEDIQDMLDGVKLLRRIAAQPALAAVIAEELAPGPQVQTDAALIADFRARSGTVYHPVSTCRIGADPAQSVVDPRLRVHGIEGLRVVDASVCPAIISGNTNAAAMMIGAKGAAMILEDAGR